ncbi:hypothetical protein [Chryseobacterium indologenes]|uniref:hypothetical protein n=1 Tax=Chryseobacterium indologenes TaxID=253 RepID=UPI0011AB7063|nr:hypothetical protein [Chryseobacterium indologenes]
MPNRILRDWTDSFIVDELDVHAERFFVRLIMKVDDFGRFSADKRLLKSQLFPLKSDIRDTDIARCLTACEKAGLITIYTVASKCYLQIENFKQTLRQKTTKYPSPDECIADATHMISNSESIASLKRNETETETETESEGEKKDPTQLFEENQFTGFFDRYGEDKGIVISTMLKAEEKERKKVAQKKESEIVDYFHEKCKNLPRVQVLSDKRKTSLKMRLKEHGEDNVLRVIEMAGESRFLSGENHKNWTADFDWIFNPTNFIKIMEGNYKNREYNVNANNNGSSQARRR